MATTVHCPKCGKNFSSFESYQSHLPCHGSILGSSGDSETAKFGSEEAAEEGGTGER